MFCKKCGANIDNDALFCENCGTAVKQVNASTPVPILTEESIPTEQVIPQSPVYTEQTPPSDGQTMAYPSAENPYDPIGMNSTIPQYATKSPQFQPSKKKSKAWIFVVAGVALAAIIAAVLLFMGPSVDQISLSETYVILRVDETISVTYTILPAEASETEVTWTSSNEAVASVNSFGKIVGNGEGTCTITITAGRQSDTLSITVVKLYEEETMIVDTWHGVACTSADSDDLTSLPEGFADCYLYDDFTGKQTLGSSTTEFTWSYDYESDGDYYYKGTQSNGVNFTMVLTDIDGTDYLIFLYDVGTFFCKR